MDKHRVRLSLNDQFRDATQLRKLITKICPRLGFGRERVYHIGCAVDEAFTNILRHSYKNNTGDVQIELYADREKVVVRIKDWGDPFDSKAVNRSSLETIVHEQREGGLGLLVMEKLMDTVEYTRTEESNELTLTKFREETLDGSNRTTEDR